MGDFGKILDEWDSLRGARSKKSADKRQRKQDDDWFARQIDRYPLVDKDKELENEGPDPALRPAQLRIEASLDLHGFTLDQALGETERFIASCLARGMRKVSIIHGKGRNGDGVLRREIRAFLERDPRAGALGYAKGSAGGRGALWVMLRNGDRSATARGR